MKVEEYFKLVFDVYSTNTNFSKVWTTQIDELGNKSLNEINRDMNLKKEYFETYYKIRYAIYKRHSSVKGYVNTYNSDLGLDDSDELANFIANILPISNEAKNIYFIEKAKYDSMLSKHTLLTNVLDFKVIDVRVVYDPYVILFCVRKRDSYARPIGSYSESDIEEMLGNQYNKIGNDNNYESCKLSKEDVIVEVADGVTLILRN